MPLKGIKTKSERDLRRRRTLDISTFTTRQPREESPPRRRPSSSLALDAGGALNHDDGSRDPEVHRMSAFIRTPPSTEETPSPTTPPIQDATPDTRRFSMLRFRNASDSQLSRKFKEHRENGVPPVPVVPASTSDRQRQRHIDIMEASRSNLGPTIITTAPTMDTVTSKADRRKSKFHPFTRQKQSLGPIVVEPESARTSLEKRPRKSGQYTVFSSLRRGKTSDGLGGLSRNLKPASEQELAPPVNGDATTEHLAPPPSRLSQSSQRSFRASEDH
ncbi:hypothetical protein LTS18_012856, partial [Coniosporium uncinatum]